MMIDAELLFDVVTGNVHITEAQLMMEAYNMQIVFNIALTDTTYSSADPLTNFVHCSLPEMSKITGYRNHPITQYVSNSLINSC